MGDSIYRNLWNKIRSDEERKAIKEFPRKKFYMGRSFGKGSKVVNKTY